MPITLFLLSFIEKWWALYNVDSHWFNWVHFFSVLRCSYEISASRSAMSHCKSVRLNTCLTLCGLELISASSFSKKFFVDAYMLGLFSDDATAVWRIKLEDNDSDFLSNWKERVDFSKIPNLFLWDFWLCPRRFDFFQPLYRKQNSLCQTLYG